MVSPNKACKKIVWQFQGRRQSQAKLLLNIMVSLEEQGKLRPSFFLRFSFFTQTSMKTTHQKVHHASIAQKLLFRRTGRQCYAQNKGFCFAETTRASVSTFLHLLCVARNLMA